MLEQQVSVEKIRRLRRVTPVDEQAIQEQLALFNQNADRVKTIVERALTLYERAVEEKANITQNPKFESFHEFLEFVDEAQQRYQDLSAQILAAAAEDRTADLIRLMPQLKQTQEAYNAHVSQVREHLQGFTERSTQTAANAQRDLEVFSTVSVIGSVILGLILAAVVTMGLVRPLHRLVQGTKEVERGNLDVQVQVRTVDEVKTLATAFNHLVDELRLKERIKDTFGKYIDPRIVEDLIEHPQQILAEGEKRSMSVCFTDVEGFTSISESLDPDELVRLINNYLSMVAIPISDHNGVIDKFIGDAIMAFWGAPFTERDDHAVRACLSALEQAEQVAHLRQSPPAEFSENELLRKFNVRTGVSTGELIVGNIGPDFSKSYTVMGDTVNIASRLESANKQYGTRILLSEHTFDLARDEIEAREIDAIQVVGKSVPVRIYELWARKGELDAARETLRERFHAALSAYRKRDWSEASRLFEVCLATLPGDPPSEVFSERIRVLREQPLPEDWDGVWRMQKK